MMHFMMVPVEDTSLSQYRSKVHSDRPRVEMSPKGETVSSSTYQQQFGVFLVH